MKLIFCIDDIGGMMFFGRRQSQDRVLRAHLLERIGDGRLWMSTYSGKQFLPDPRIVINDDYMAHAEAEDFCFIEDGAYDLTMADEVILCHWNRRYQADKFFKVDLTREGFAKVQTEQIKGSSHDKITIETYRRTTT
jgi:hypothetical protein